MRRCIAIYSLGSRAEHVYRSLQSAVTDGTYPLGSKLPSQIELARRFSVAPMTVRMAVTHLEHEGLVERCPRSGMFVRATVSVSDVLEGRDEPVQAAIDHATNTDKGKDIIEQHAVLRTVFETAPLGISLTDANGRHLRNNARRCELLGYSEEELARLTFKDFTHPDDLGRELALYRELVAGTCDAYALDKRYIRKDGSIIWAHLKVAAVRTEDGTPSFIVAMTEDVTERHALEERFRHRVLHDDLTELPNRTFLAERMAGTIQHSKEDQRPLALLLLDLDRFSLINGAFGQEFGDLLLREVGKRLSTRLSSGGMVARVSGDEFAVLLENTDAEAAIEVASILRRSLHAEYLINGQSLVVTGTFGIAVYPEHGEDVHRLLQRADMAMHLAREQGRDVAVYDVALDSQPGSSLTMIGDLRRALGGDELLLHYQPKVDLRDGSIAGVEALVRWQHPRRGWILPGEFIGVAEDSGLIGSLTTWTVHAALMQAAAWQRNGVGINVAVNLSARTLHDVATVDMITRALAQWGVAPEHLTLEITETSLMMNPAVAMDIVTRLHAAGIHVAIDDFGTGYSSLSYLTDLPVNEVKIDRSFVLDMIVNERHAVIVRSVIDLGHNLGLEVVAEGVEDNETYQALADMGCDVIQGYFIGRPCPAADAENWLVRKSA